MKKILIILIVFLQACMVSRTARPKLTGYVFDAATLQPIQGCKVGETTTDSIGFFELRERRYTEFTFPGMEAPSLYIHEIVEHNGYKNDTIDLFSKFGGGQAKGAHWELDTVYLTKKQ